MVHGFVVKNLNGIRKSNESYVSWQLGVINILMNAKEAREETNKILNECLTQEFFMIERRINNAIRNGEYSINQNGKLSAYAQSKLKQLGYEVKIGTQYNESYYTINWK